MAKALMFVGSPNRVLPYLGNARGVGISAFRVDLVTGVAEPLGIESDVENPVFIAISPDGRSLAATSELDGVVEGAISMFAIDRASGGLRLQGRQSTLGWTAAHAGFAGSSAYVAAANYAAVPVEAPAGASIAVYRRAADGTIGPAVSQATITGTGPNAARQERTHAHCVRWTPDGRFVIVADLGVDALVIYRFDAASGALTPHGRAALAPGAGPRHFAFHPNGRFAYVISELDCTVTSFTFDAATAGFRALGAERTLPVGVDIANWCSALVVAPDGRHLFAGNRGHDSVARFDIDAAGLAHFAGTTPSGGAMPRDFALAPDGSVLAVANVAESRVSLFRHDAQSGALSPLGVPIEVGTPSAIAFHPTLE